MKAWLQSKTLNHVAKSSRRIKKRAQYLGQCKSIGSKPVARLYMQAEDPRSYLMVQVLSKLQQAFPQIDFDYEVIPILPNESPKPLPHFKQWIYEDSQALADYFNLTPPTFDATTSTRIAAMTGHLHHLRRGSYLFEQAAFDLKKFWQGKPIQHPPMMGSVVTGQTQKLIDKKYLSTNVLYFGGEWFQGLERLHHFEQAMLDSGFECKTKERLTWPTSETFHLEGVSKVRKVSMWLSLQSPYDYIGFYQLLSWQKKIGFEIEYHLMDWSLQKSVPAKIFLASIEDAAREAEFYQLPFQSLNDGKGTGIALLHHHYQSIPAEKRTTFFKHCFQNIWQEGMNLSKPKAIVPLLTKLYELGATPIENTQSPVPLPSSKAPKNPNLIKTPCYQIETTDNQCHTCLGYERLAIYLSQLHTAPISN